MQRNASFARALVSRVSVRADLGRRLRRGSMLMASFAALLLMMPLMVLAIDWGRMQLAYSELQTAVDHAARFGGAGLYAGPKAARQQALNAVRENLVDGGQLPEGAIIVTQTGHWNADTSIFTEETDPDTEALALRVQVTLPEPAGLMLDFGTFAGRERAGMQAEAVAQIRGRKYAETIVPATSNPWLAAMPAGLETGVSRAFANQGNPYARRDKAGWGSDSDTRGESPTSVQGVEIDHARPLAFHSIVGEMNLSRFSTVDNYATQMFGADGNTEVITHNWFPDDANQEIADMGGTTALSSKPPKRGLKKGHEKNHRADADGNGVLDSLAEIDDYPGADFDPDLEYENDYTLHHADEMWTYKNEERGAGRPTNGMSNVRAPYNALMGVFLSNSDPRTQMTPEALDFSTPGSRNFGELRPQVGQVFFIGDGLADDGTPQTFVPPDGAKRLYLASMDGFEWMNNGGAFQTTIYEPGSVVLVK